MESFDSLFAAWLAQARARAADGLTFREAMCLALDGAKQAIQFAMNVNATGEEKKDMVVAAVERLYLEFLAKLPIPYVPKLFQAQAHRWLTLVLDPVLDAFIEWLYVQLKPKPFK